MRGYVDTVVISCGAEIIARHVRSYEREDFVFDPLHYLALLEQKIGALDQAAPLAGWQLPEAFATLRRLLEARMGKQGKREFVQVLRLMEVFRIDDVAAGVRDAIDRGVIGFDAVKHLVLCRIERRPPRLDMSVYPYLPHASVATDLGQDVHGPAHRGDVMTDTPQLLLGHHLKVLKLPTFLREYDKLARQCATEGVEHTGYLLRLAELELIERERRMVERRIKEARFPAVKSLDSFDFLALPSLNKTLVLELARCEYVLRRENVIAVGNSGTGKSHVALGLGLAACQKGLSVGFTTAAALVNELLEARDEKRLLRLQRQLAAYKLLVIDELGYVPLSQTGAELLFEVFSQRYERGSTIVTSNLPFDEWTSVFASERLTGALLDRLTHHVHILEMNGDSYRLKQSKRRQRGAPVTDLPEDHPRSKPEMHEGPPRGAFMLSAVRHFYSGQPMHFYSGVDKFSGGQRQRIAIARSLALKPECLVLDEPVSALDVSIQAQIVNLLAEQQRQRGLTYLFISHDLSLVRCFADRVAVMYLGRVCELGPVGAVLDRPRHHYTSGLLWAVPDIKARTKRRAVVGGELPNPVDPPPGCAFHTRCPAATERCRREVPPLTAEARRTPGRLPPSARIVTNRDKLVPCGKSLP